MPYSPGDKNLSNIYFMNQAIRYTEFQSKHSLSFISQMNYTISVSDTLKIFVK